MADSDDRFDRLEAKIDKLTDHVVELMTKQARAEGADLPDRVEKLEQHVQADLQRWAKLGVMGTVGSIFGVEAVHLLLKKLGISP